MATYTFNKAVIMHLPFAWVEGASYDWKQTHFDSFSASSVTLTDDDTFSAIFYGSFTYSDQLDSGTVTGFDISRNGSLAYTVRDVNLDVATVNNLTVYNDPRELVLRNGDDTINGSAFDDFLTGRSGNDILNGGNGFDTATYTNNITDYSFTYTNGVISVQDNNLISGGDEGTDTLTSIENLLFGNKNYEVIDPYAYLAANKDLISIFGNNTDAAYEHYFSFGIYEDRPIQFNALQYIASNGDLISAFGDNTEAATQHYINNGFAEGRPIDFNVLQYIASNSDLVNAFGDNTEAATLHYINNGHTEDRPTDFNALQYLASNYDLMNAFDGNTEAATLHYINNGFTEGRSASFDALNYVASYSDLIGAFGTNAEAATLHFVNSGFAEGRTANFDALSYIASNEDLINVFGLNTEAATEHYINFGFSENRNIDFDIDWYFTKYPGLFLEFGSNTEAALLDFINNRSRAGYNLSPEIEGLVITGDDSSNTLYGGLGDDTINGGNGDDLIIGFAGEDNLDGGEGSDTYQINALTEYTKAEINDRGLTGIDTLKYTPTATDTTLTLFTDIGIEQVDLGNSSNGTSQINLDASNVSNGLIINGNAGKNNITGTSFTDVITGGLGKDVLDGAEGSDIYMINRANEQTTPEIIDSGTTGVDEVRFSSTTNDETLTLFEDVGIEKVVIGTGTDSEAITTGTATLNVDASNLTYSTTIIGNDGNNSLTSTQYVDTLQGNKGDDTYHLSDGDIVIEKADEGNDTVITSSTYVVLQDHIENITYSGEYSTGFTFTGNDQDNIITSNESYMWGPILMNGGNGNDTLIGVRANNQRLNGDAGNDTITGNSDNDILNGGTGDDIMNGGSGSDTYYIDSIGDQVIEVIYNYGYDIDTVNTSLNTYSAIAGIENVNFIGSGDFTAIGDESNNVITGGSGNDNLSGLEGNDTLDGISGLDTLTGGKGDDTYLNVTAATTIVENAFEGTDTISTSESSYTLATHLENLTYTGTSSFNGSGNFLNNEITGSTGDDTLYGLGGNDILRAGAGTNHLYGGTGDDTYYLTYQRSSSYATDTIIEGVDEGVDTIMLADAVGGTIFTLPNNIENISYFNDPNYHHGSGTSGLTIHANAADNYISNSEIVSNFIVYAYDGDDTIDNSGGYYGSTLYGGNGNDTITGTWSSDIIVGGKGSDILAGGNEYPSDIHDVFKWQADDKGTTNSPDIDIITDFEMPSNETWTTNAKGDTLDLRDLLIGESNANENLLDYLDITVTYDQTEIRISSNGDFSNGVYDANNVDVRVILTGVDAFTATGTSTETDLIQNLITNNQLLVD